MGESGAVVPVGDGRPVPLRPAHKVPVETAKLGRGGIPQNDRHVVAEAARVWAGRPVHQRSRRAGGGGGAAGAAEEGSGRGSGQRPGPRVGERPRAGGEGSRAPVRDGGRGSGTLGACGSGVVLKPFCTKLCPPPDIFSSGAVGALVLKARRVATGFQKGGGGGGGVASADLLGRPPPPPAVRQTTKTVSPSPNRRPSLASVGGAVALKSTQRADRAWACARATAPRRAHRKRRFRGGPRTGAPDPQHRPRTGRSRRGACGGSPGACPGTCRRACGRPTRPCAGTARSPRTSTAAA